MTVSSTTDRKTFTGDDLTVAFATSPLVFFDETDLQVYVITTATGAEELQSLTTDYTVTGGAGSTGTVTMLTAPASTQTLLIKRVLPITQGADFVNNDAADAEVAEDALDKLTMIAQQNAAGNARALQLPDAETVTDALTVLPFDRASSVLGFDASKNLTTYDASSAVTESSNVTFLQSGTGAIATTLQTKNRRYIDLLDFATGDGLTDDTAGVQAAITEAVSKGYELIGKKGMFRCTSSLIIPSNLQMRGEDTCRIYRDWVGTQAVNQSLIRQATYTSKISNVKIEGFSFGAEDSANEGKIICLHGDDMTFNYVFVDGFYKGQAFVLSGDYIRMLAPKTRNHGVDVGEGGIRVVGGTGFRCFMPDVDSGDDALQFVPIATAGGDNANQTITDGFYIGGRGISAAARSVVAALVGTSGSSIIRCGFLGVTGNGGGRACYIGNFDDATGVVQHITARDVKFNQLGMATAQNQEIFLDRSEGTVSHIYLDGVEVHNPIKVALSITGAVSRVYVRGGFYGKPSTSGNQSILVSQGDVIEFDGVTSEGATGTNPVNLGSGSTTVTNVKWHGGHIYGIENTFYGINAIDCDGLTVGGGVTFYEKSGETTARAIRIGGSSSKVRINNIDASNFTAAESGRILVVDASTDVAIGKDCIGFTTDSYNTTAVGNVGAGTDNLQQRTIPLSLFRACKRIKIKAVLTTANNSNPKTGALLFGSATLVSQALTISQAGTVVIEATVNNTGTDTQRYSGVLTESGGTLAPVVFGGTATENDGAAIVVKTTGVVTDGGGGINNDDIQSVELSVTFEY